LRCSALVALLCLVAAPALAQEPPAERPLAIEPGAPLRAELAPGETHAYTLTAAAGDYVHLSLLQGREDLVLRLIGPGGAVLADEDRRPQSSEQVHVVVDQPGAHRVEVSACRKDAGGSSYELRLEALRPAGDEDRVRAAAAKAMADAEAVTGEPRRALKLAEEAASLWRRAGERGEESYARMRAGRWHHEAGEDSAALEQAEAALSTALELEDRWLEGRARLVVAAVCWGLGEYARAVPQYQDALAIWRALGDRGREAESIAGLGLSHWSLGELQEALDALREALQLRRALGQRAGEATTLHNLGMVYLTAGQNRRALEYYQQSLVLKRAAGERRSEAKTLHSMGRAYRNLGEQAKALEHYRQALAIQREVQDRGGLAMSLDSIGRILRLQGNNRASLAAHEEALETARAAGDRRAEGFALEGLGLVQGALGDAESALRRLEQATELFSALGDRPMESGAWREVAKLRRDAGELDEARAAVEKGIALREDLRSGLVGDELRSSYGSSSRVFYDIEIDVLMRLHARRPAEGLDALAWAANERGRARGLLEALAEARAGIREGIDPALVAQERELRRRLSVQERQRLRLLDEKAPAERAARSERDVQVLLREYADLQERLRVASPRYADLVQPQPLSLREVQEQVLDGESLLLEYALGESRSVLWAVTREGMHSYVLPSREILESAARRAYELLIKSRERAFRGQAELAAAELSRMVLGPVSGLLGRRRLVVVADGALQYVPFAALPHPAQGAGAPPLIASQEVVHLPSASSLALLRREAAGRQPARKLVAVLSDPVFQPEDPRVRHAGRTAVAPAPPPPAEGDGEGSVTRAAVETGLSSLERLRSSRREADAIAALARPGAAFKALDFAASRAAAMSPALGDYRIVHFATHGLLNSRHPELSGIVLSLVDEEGRPQDGFLRLQDLYNLKLNADLVVLSACQTALGSEVKGEGLVGLTRGFFYAGVSRVVASLWGVRDEATAELMTRFYRGLLQGRLSPAAALRAAQLSMWNDPQWRAPAYWAGFILQGEWGPLQAFEPRR
jgi:CHAT domain-containing protein/tetratricopeptide (TPR) repeat protein